MKNRIAHMIYKTTGTSNLIRRIEWRSMFKYLDPKKCGSILDIACGGGELSLKVAERGCEVFGIDISESGIERAKRLAEKRGYHASLKLEVQRICHIQMDTSIRLCAVRP